MALFNSFQFGDVDSKDYGVYISGNSVYDSPARSVDLVQVPGRNGALALDNGYYENIEVTYPAGSFGTSQEEWREKMLGIRNALAAQRGYQKLIDTYHPEHYRLGMFFAGISASPVQYNRAGQFPIRFNCKPQRFLSSGDEAVTVDFDSYKIADNDEPYLFRKSGGSSDIGDADRARIDHLTGGTVAWNQLLQNGNFADGTSAWTAVDSTLAVSNNVATATPSNANSRLETLFKTIKGHKYFRSVTFKGTANGEFYISWYGAIVNRTALTGSLQTISDIIDNTYDSNNNWRLFIGTYNRTNLESYQVSNVMVCDLTQMFGSTIADYLYNLEQSTTGAGVALFKSMFPKPYYEYNAGELMSVQGLTSHDIVGFNQWDEEWELGSYLGSTGAPTYSDSRIRSKNTFPIRVLPNTAYCFTSPSATARISQVCWYDADDNFIASQAVANAIQILTSPANAFYLRFHMSTAYGNIYNHDICINLSWSGTHNGEYESYAKNSYPLDSSLALRGVPKLVNNQIQYDGDTYEPSGKVTRKYGIVDLGTLNWIYESPTPRFYSTGLSTVIKRPSSGIVAANIICSQYKTTAVEGNGETIFGGEGDALIAVSTGGAVSVRDTRYTSSAAFKTAMSGVYLVYELATPTTETVSTYEEVQNVYAGGTEEFIDEREVAVPVGHTTDYFNSEGYQLTNPTNFPAKPLIRVYGNGSVQVGDTIATVQNNADGYVDIDCESMNCYDTTGGRNADVSFSGNDFPELASGNNSILLTGPSKVEITPRWWEL